MRFYPHSAFLSYSSRYADWVEALHANLEATLARHGESRPVFLDRLDVAAGASWVTQLAAGVNQAAKLVLVVTPEALASPRVGDEWQALVDSRRDWSRGQPVPVVLVWAPLPLFLGPIQYVDFRGHDEAGYAAGLSMGRDARGIRKCRTCRVHTRQSAHSGVRPLFAAQSSIWVAQVLDPESADYCIAEYLEILGPVDPGVFEAALRRVVTETDALRLRYLATEDGPRQQVGDDPDWTMPLVDVSSLADPRAAAGPDGRSAAERRRLGVEPGSISSTASSRGPPRPGGSGRRGRGRCRRRDRVPT